MSTNISLYTSLVRYSYGLATFIANELTKSDGVYFTTIPVEGTVGYWKITNRFDPRIVKSL